MGVTDKLPLLNSSSKILRLIGYGLYGVIGLFLFLIVLGALVGPDEKSTNAPHKTANDWYNEGNAFFNQGYDLLWNQSSALYDQGKDNEAAKAMDEGRKTLDEAVQAYDEAIKLDPNLANAWNNKGLALYHRGYDQGKNRYDEAIKAFNEAIKLDPKLANAWINKGHVLFEQEKYDEAIKAYDETIKLDPKLANAWYGKANSLDLLGRKTEAYAVLSKAKEFTEKSTNTPQVTKAYDDEAWFSSVTDTSDLIYEEVEAIEEQFGYPEYDTRQTAIDLRQKLQNSLDASKEYRVSPPFETNKDEYEAALKLYIMNLDTLLDAIETLNTNGYAEGSRAMNNAQTALTSMDHLGSAIAQIDGSNA